MYNSQVVEFINSPYTQTTVFEDEASLQIDMVDKLNGVAKESSDHILLEKYELRF